MVIGEGRPYLAALVVLNADEWRRESALLEGQGEPSPSPEASAAFLLERIRKAVKSFPVYATPHAVWRTTEPWTIAAGLLTPTLKIKRAALARRFAGEIESLYDRRAKRQADLA
jgi:long-chain acyl-CoA synthetase